MCKNRIRKILKLLKEETILVNSPPAKVAGAWDDISFKKLRVKIRRYLRKAQHNTCCYCKLRVTFKPKEMAIEHVISKDRNPLFTYNLHNLALICRNCNSTKGPKFTYLTEVAEKNLTRYPHTSSSFIIPHPHFDHYSHHVEFKMNFYPVEVDGSKKGENLIEMCELRTIWRLLERADLYFQENSKGLERKIYSLLDVEGESETVVLNRVNQILKEAGII